MCVRLRVSVHVRLECMCLWVCELLCVCDRCASVYSCVCDLESMRVRVSACARECGCLCLCVFDCVFVRKCLRICVSVNVGISVSVRERVFELVSVCD